MTQKRTETLTPELFEQVKQDDEKLRDIAHAHELHDSNHVYKRYETLSHPVRYIVSKEQKEEAIKLFEQKKAAFMEENKHNLVVTCMGITDEKECGDLMNHRIRMYFKNKAGTRYFVELIQIGYNNYFVEHSDNYDMSISEEYCNTGKYRNHGLKKRTKFQDFTRQKLLELINSTFDCDFKKIVIDENFVNCDDEYFPESK